MAARTSSSALWLRAVAELPAASGASRLASSRHYTRAASLRSTALRLNQHAAAAPPCPRCGGARPSPSMQVRTALPVTGRLFTSSARIRAPQGSSTAANAATAATAQPEIAITTPPPPSSPIAPNTTPFRGADIKAEADAKAAAAAESTENSPACATLSPSSPSAPRSQQKAPAAAATAASTPSASSNRRNGAAFRPKKAALTLTPQAVVRLRALSESPSGPKLIRIGVRNKGCAGMSYHLEYVSPDQAGKFDEKVVQDGVKVLIDSKALFSIIGSEMDWKDDKLSSKFIFNNPNVKEACGCGESFLT